MGLELGVRGSLFLGKGGDGMELSGRGRSLFFFFKEGCVCVICLLVKHQQRSNGQK